MKTNKESSRTSLPFYSIFVHLFYKLFFLLRLPDLLCSLNLALFKTPDGDHLVYLPLDVIDEICKHKIYDVARLKKDAVVVDVGAHIGIYTLRAAKIVGDNGFVVAVEPEPANVKLLSFHLKINERKNVIIVERALNDKSGIIKLYISELSTSHSIIEERKTEKFVYVRAITWDELLDGLNIRHVDVAKIDAEGAEINIIKGMKKVLPESLVISAYHSIDEATEIRELLESKGYQAHVVCAHNHDLVYARKHRNH